MAAPHAARVLGDVIVCRRPANAIIAALLVSKAED